MSERTPNQRNTEGGELYGTSWEHLSEELRYLDLLIRQQVVEQRRRHSVNSLDLFKGVVLSEEEIDDLLTDTTTPSREDAEKQTLLEQSRQLETRIQKRRAASLESGVYLSLPHLAQLFRLTSFEEKSFLICFAPELDPKYEKLYAYLQDDVTRTKPSVGLVFSLLCRTMQERLEARLAFQPQAPLLKYRLLQMAGSSSDGQIPPLLSRALKLDDRVVNFLLGFGPMDSRLESAARLVPPQTDWNGLTVTVTEAVQRRMRDFIHSHFTLSERDQRGVVFYFHGPYGSGKRSLAEAITCDLGLPLIIGDVKKMCDSPSPFEEAAWLLGRETVLQSAVLCLENFDCLLTEDDDVQFQLKSLLEAVQNFSRLTFLLSDRLWNPRGLLKGQIFIELEFPVPDDNARKRLWEDALNGNGCFAGDIDIGALASQFRFTPGQIGDALVAAQNHARWRSPDDPITTADLYAACRAQSNPKLSALAQKLKPKYTWDDIVLPPDQSAQLMEICNQAKNRQIVYGEWGFDQKLSLGRGLNALFSGPPGTGKTMAAEVIANALELDLYKIDLSQVVSKYIGETEKNLDRIFNEAQTSYAILFFDEADALFGKRSEVKDAHDRYANIEIGYLLQKMEEYDGIAILATNLRQNMDEAFVRRMQFIVEFPFPDEAYRRRIWEVVFPREAPLGDDVDVSRLAREVRLAGGNIKNIALAAAFYAAEAGSSIQMMHLVQAARREHQKLGRTFGG